MISVTIGSADSDEKSFEIADGRRTMEHAKTISSPRSLRLRCAQKADFTGGWAFDLSLF